MKFINSEQIDALDISPKECVDWVEEGFRLKNSAVLPPKISMKLGESGFFNTMPCSIPSIQKIGVKTVSRYPERIPSIKSELLLYNSDKGNLLAVMDADWITTMRTGAVAALSIKKLSNINSHNLSFIGLGNTARATLLCYLNLDLTKKYKVRLYKYKDQHLSFIQQFENFSNVSFELIDNMEEFVVGADILVSCITAASSTLAKVEWFSKGVLLVPVHTRGFENCDLVFDKIFGDDIGHIEGFKNFKNFKKFDEFSEVVRGNSGRENEEERIIAYNIGIALHDVFFAHKIFSMLYPGLSNS